MKTHLDYVKDAITYLDSFGGNAQATQLQTINMALLMAIIDLIKTMEENMDDPTPLL